MAPPAKTSKLAKLLLRSWTFDMGRADRTIYLTFDDGPHPESTPRLLAMLAEFDAKATFFCVGTNAELAPELVAEIRAAGHCIGNHTYSHRHGRKMSTDAYVDDVERCRAVVGNRLFRPAYGYVTRPQFRRLAERDYRFVAWDVNSGDLFPDVSPEQCLDNVTRHVDPGSIVVFHDTPQIFDKLAYALPRTLRSLTERGYRFEALTPARLGA